MPKLFALVSEDPSVRRTGPFTGKGIRGQEQKKTLRSS